MTWVALKSLAERRVRAGLTAFAIVLGVAMVAGTLILTDTIDKAFDNIFSSSYTNTDLVVTGTPVVEASASGAPTVPASLLQQVRDIPGVAEAAGSMVDLSGSANQAKLIDRDGELIQGGAPTFGFGVDPSHPRFNPMELTKGAWAQGAGQVVIDADTAAGHGFAVGDTIGVAAEGPVREFTVSGIARFGGVDSLGGATIAVWDIATARDMLGKTGFDAIQVAAEPGVSGAELASRIEPLLPATAEISTGDEQAVSDGEQVSEFVTFIRGFLLSFGGIALFVGAFVIFNTLSITVAQRSRELATLRTLGASRRQVLRSVIAEAGIVGLAASLVGLGLGVGLAKGLMSVFRAMGLDLPTGATVFEPSTAVVALLTGTLITLVAGVVPAIRATRVPAIAAVREGSVLPRGRMSRLTPLLALVAVGLAGAMLAQGALGDGLGVQDRLMMLGGGTLALFVGIAVISPQLVRPIAAVVGWPIARLGGASGELARQNAVRNPSRTAATAAALMIGLALVTFVSVLGAGLKDTSGSAVEQQVSADYVVTSSNGWETVATGVGRQVASAPQVTSASSVRQDSARVAGSEERVSGVDPATITAVYDFGWSAGSSDEALTGLRSDGAILEEAFAEDHDLRVGSPITIVTPSGSEILRTVTGIYSPPRLAPVLETVLISQSSFDASFPRPRDIFTLVNVAGGPSEEGALALEGTLGGFPDGKVQTGAAFADQYAGDLDIILNLLYVLLALSVLVSLFGMVNTLILSVHERTRELGMLRAVGMTRRQARRMVRGESIVTALIGAALGMPLGIGMAALVTRSLSEWGVEMVLPLGMLAAFALVAIAAGILAAVVPARRASRLNVQNALQYE